VNVRHFLNLKDAGAEAVAAILGEAMARKEARAGWPKGKADADKPLDGRYSAADQADLLAQMDRLVLRFRRTEAGTRVAKQAGLLHRRQFEPVFSQLQRTVDLLPTSRDALVTVIAVARIWALGAAQETVADGRVRDVEDPRRVHRADEAVLARPVQTDEAEPHRRTGREPSNGKRSAAM